MSNEKNLKKLNKSDVSNISGGQKWYVKEFDENDGGPFWHSMLEVFDEKGNSLGKVANFDCAVELAEENGLTNFDLEKSTLDCFLKDCEEYKKRNN